MVVVAVVVVGDFQEIASSFSIKIKKSFWQVRVKCFSFSVESKRKERENGNEPQKEKKEILYYFFNVTSLLKTAQFTTKFWRHVKSMPWGALWS